MIRSLWKGCRRLAALLFRRVRFVVLKVSLPRPPSPEPVAEGVWVREITAADQQRVASIPHASAAFEFTERLATSKGVMVIDADGPAGYAWCTGGARAKEGTAHFHFPVIPAPGTGYIFDVIVAPTKRGGGYGRLLLAALLAQAEREGMRSVFLFTGIHNQRMRRLCSSLGFCEAGELKFCRVLGQVSSDVSALRSVGGAWVKHVRLEQLIRDKLGFDPSGAEIVEIVGGTNQCFSVSRADAHYFVRLPGPSGASLGIRRDVEIATLKAVSSAGVCAEPVYFSEADGTMITTKIEGRQLSRRAFSSRSTIRNVVETVKRIHGITAVQHAFSPYSQIRDRIRMARQKNVPLPDYLDGLMARLDGIERRNAVNPQKFTGLCHNDLIVENFIFSDSVRILDWEFAGMGDVFYDLATLSLYLSERKRKYLLKCYFGSHSRQYHERLNDMLFVARFWNAMWAVTLDDGTEKASPYRHMAASFFESIRDKSFIERCLYKSRVPRALRKVGRVLARYAR